MRPPLEQGSPLDSATTDRPVKAADKRGAGSFFKELPVLILIAFGLALLIKTFLIQAFWIPSESMEPALLRGDRVLVNKLVYRFREPRRGEILVFARESDPGEPRSLARRVIDFLTEGLGAAQPGEQDLIKRVIGLPGETLELKDGIIAITRADGSRLTLNEPYLAEERELSPHGPTVIPAGSYFMMGDNRTSSQDSRFFGSIKRSAIVGKAFVRVWPPGRWGVFSVPGYERAGTASAAVLLVAAGRRRRRAVRAERRAAA